MKPKRIKYGKEPFLNVHRYVVVVIHDRCRTKMHYAMNLAGVQEVRDAAPKGSVVEVYEAQHNFREAWQK